MLKGRQSGGIHRGHAWVFRAESYDTMLAWFSDIKNLTEKTGEERNAFIRRSHARSVSGSSNKALSVNSDDRALDEDEADQVPYSATPSQADIKAVAQEEKLPQRPIPGGRFPSALNINRDSQVPLSPSSPASSGDRDVVAAAGALPGSGLPFGNSGQQVQAGDDETRAGKGEPIHSIGASAAPGTYSPPVTSPTHHSHVHPITRHDSTYGEWMAPVGAAAATGGLIGVAAANKNRERQLQKEAQQEAQPGLQAVDGPSPVSLPAATSPFTNDVAPVVSPISPNPPLPAPTTTTTTVTSSLMPSDLQTSTVTSTTTTSKTDPLISPAPLPIGTSSLSQSHLEDPAAPIKNLAKASDPAEPIRDLVNRPPLESQNSIVTISDLHVPGEFR